MWGKTAVVSLALGVACALAIVVHTGSSWWGMGLLACFILFVYSVSLWAEYEGKEFFPNLGSD